MKKYELTGQKIRHAGRVLYRIRAVRAFGDVSAGELGGYVESERNLSHDGLAWVSGDARVYGHARVSGDARVSSAACVYGAARLSGTVHVSGAAHVGGTVQLSDNTWIRGTTYVSDETED